LATYNDARSELGLGLVEHFADITSNSQLQQKLRHVYGDVNQVDVWVGGLAEDHLPGTSVGPLFHRVLVDQFERIRDGDRFWYQCIFSGRTLQSLEATTLADVIQRNTDVKKLQTNVFFSVDVPVVDDPHKWEADQIATVATAPQARKEESEGYGAATAVLQQYLAERKAVPSQLGAPFNAAEVQFEVLDELIVCAPLPTPDETSVLGQIGDDLLSG
jgi:hypothetical protein